MLILHFQEKDNEIHQLNDSFTIKEKELKEVKGTKDAIEQNVSGVFFCII